MTSETKKLMKQANWKKSHWAQEIGKTVTTAKWVQKVISQFMQTCINQDEVQLHSCQGLETGSWEMRRLFYKAPKAARLRRWRRRGLKCQRCQQQSAEWCGLWRGGIPFPSWCVGERHKLRQQGPGWSPSRKI